MFAIKYFMYMTIVLTIDYYASIDWVDNLPNNASLFTFRDCMMKLIMAAGDSNSNCCVAGAVLGCKFGFSHLPKHWVHGLRKKQTAWLNVKVNLLLDMIGLPWPLTFVV